MQNGFNQAYNKMPKENSKSQQAKKKNKRSAEQVVCAKCGRGDLTLYRDKNSKEKQYFCKEHLTV